MSNESITLMFLKVLLTTAIEKATESSEKVLFTTEEGSQHRKQQGTVSLQLQVAPYSYIPPDFILSFSICTVSSWTDKAKQNKMTGNIWVNCGKLCEK